MTTPFTSPTARRSTRTSTRTKQRGPGSRTTCSKTPTTATYGSASSLAPCFADDDQQYRGVQLPRQFWKLVCMVKETGQLSATAYLLSQEDLIEGLEALEEFEYGAYKTFQVPIERVEKLTELDFGPLRDADPLAGLEAAVEAREVRSANDLVL